MAKSKQKAATAAEQPHIARLKASKRQWIDDTSERAMDAGRRWAQEVAEYAELHRLAEEWPRIESTNTDDAYGPLGVFLRVIHGEDFGGRSDVEDFFVNLGEWVVREDLCNSAFWDDFGEGAMEVFTEVISQ